MKLKKYSAIFWGKLAFPWCENKFFRLISTYFLKELVEKT